MPYIVLEEPNSGDKYFIECAQLPGPGAQGTLEIQNVRRDTHVDPAGNYDYDFIAIPVIHVKPGNPGPGAPDMTIDLDQDMQPTGQIILPFNGGVPFVEISVKNR